jgi:hypothetical protein
MNRLAASIHVRPPAPALSSIQFRAFAPRRCQCSCISPVEVVRRNLTAGDGTVEYVHKVKLIE